VADGDAAVVLDAVAHVVVALLQALEDVQAQLGPMLWFRTNVFVK
jgi:hypothetical protein